MLTEIVPTRWLKHVAPWLPIAILVSSACVAFAVQARAEGVRPRSGRVAGRFSVGHSCRRQSSWSLHAHPDLPVANRSVPPIRRLAREEPATGFCDCSTRRRLAELPASWSGLLRDARHRVATPTLAFTAILAVSIGLVLLQRSPFVATLTGGGWRVAGGPEVTSPATGLSCERRAPVRSSELGGFCLGRSAGSSFYLSSNTGTAANVTLSRGRP